MCMQRRSPNADRQRPELLHQTESLQVHAGITAFKSGALQAGGLTDRLTPEAAELEAEDDEGNVEYKLRLKQPNHVRFQQLVCLPCSERTSAQSGHS